MKIRIALLASMLLFAAHSSAQQQPLRIGFITTLSGPFSPLGVDIRDGFNLALKLSGGKLGGLTVQMSSGDDQTNPEVGRQLMDRYIKADRAHLITGILGSNVHVAVAPIAAGLKVPYLMPNGGPSQLAGAACSPFYSSTAWQNDAYHEATGQYAASKSMNNIYMIAPNYPAGKDALTGFKRFYKGKVTDEVYVKLGQLDFAAEISQMRAAKPETVYAFLPGGMGVNFIKQFVAAGLSKDIKLLVPGFIVDQDVIPAMGDSVLGLFNIAHWALDFDNPENKRFVAEFEKEYKRLPSVFAAQSYDAAMLVDAAVRQIKGKVDDREAFAKALHTAKYKSVRGEYTVNANGFPIQDYYLRVVSKDSQGRLVNKTLGKATEKLKDSYGDACKAK